MSKESALFDLYPDYKATIGIEIHVQLTTNTKIFCSCANQIAKTANVNICAICTGQPGSLPVLNRQVIDYAILVGLATNCTITQTCNFARKHYFYPDLPKGFQTTQSDLPICTNGYIEITKEDGTPKKIRINRIHMEEDAGKNTHITGGSESLVDFNRAGTPLLEIVTEPDIDSAFEARAYLKALHQLVRYLRVGTGNMEEGAFRGDTNVSVKKKIAEQLGTKVELKNINSFKYISDATEYEIERQIELIESGGKVRQETRLWDTKNKKTVVMRSKEEAADYRYFYCPDLPTIIISDEWMEKIRQNIPELPAQKQARLMRDMGLSAYETEILLDDQTLCDYFEAAYKAHSSKHVINWVLRDVMAYTKEHKIEIADLKITPTHLASLAKMIDMNVINNRAAQEIFAHAAESGKDPLTIVKELGLEQVGASDELEAIIKEIIDSNAQSVAEYKSGKEKLFGFFVGLAMQKTKGKGNPKVIQDLLKKYLS